MSWDQIPGWFDFMAIYDQAIDESKDGDVLVEVGVAFGRSLAYLARKAIDSKKKLHIYGVDPWVDDWSTPTDYDPRNGRPTWGAEHAEWARSVGGPFNAFICSMREHAPEELEYVNVLRTTSVKASLMFPMVRMAFLDGNHNFDEVCRDIRAWYPRVMQGGIMAGHDFTPNFPGVEEAVHELLPDAVRRENSFYLRVA